MPPHFLLRSITICGFEKNSICFYKKMQSVSGEWEDFANSVTWRLALGLGILRILGILGILSWREQVCKSPGADNKTGRLDSQYLSISLKNSQNISRASTDPPVFISASAEISPRQALGTAYASAPCGAWLCVRFAPHHQSTSCGAISHSRAGFASEDRQARTGVRTWRIERRTARSGKARSLRRRPSGGCSVRQGWW